jgi:hypothetical protein
MVDSLSHLHQPIAVVTRHHRLSRDRVLIFTHNQIFGGKLLHTFILYYRRQVLNYKFLIPSALLRKFNKFELIFKTQSSIKSVIPNLNFVAEILVPSSATADASG